MAQLTAELAVEKATPYVQAWAPEYSHESPRVVADSMDAYGEKVEYFHVQFGEAVVWLLADGSLRGFANMSSGAIAPSAEVDCFGSDEEAWRAFEEAAAIVRVPSGVKRFQLERVAHKGLARVYRFSLRPAPYGYEGSEGNYLILEMHRATGRVVAVSVADGWTYEVPNVQISPDSARARAAAELGGLPADYSVTLRYAMPHPTRAPSHYKSMIKAKALRLMYVVSSPKGTAIVDTTSADIVNFARPDRANNPTRRNGEKFTNPNRHVENAVRDSAATRSEVSNEALVYSGAILVIASIIAVIRRPARRPME